jgi:hypothetical protein
MHRTHGGSEARAQSPRNIDFISVALFLLLGLVPVASWARFTETHGWLLNPSTAGFAAWIAQLTLLPAALLTRYCARGYRFGISAGIGGRLAHTSPLRPSQFPVSARLPAAQAAAPRSKTRSYSIGAVLVLLGSPSGGFRSAVCRADSNKPAADAGPASAADTIGWCYFRVFASALQKHFSAHVRAWAFEYDGCCLISPVSGETSLPG